MRKASYDLARIIACLAIVMIHTVMLFWEFDPTSPTWIVYNFLSLAVRFGIPLFFMLSGALLLGKTDLDFRKHLRRMGHFVLLFYIWSLVCYGLDARFFHIWTQGEDFWTLVLTGYYHEWFLPALVLCYGAVPFLHGVIHRERENAEAGVWLLGTLIVGLATLGSLPDKPLLLNALLSPWNLSDLRYLVCFVTGWLLAEKKLSGRALTLLGTGALATILIFSRLNRLYAMSIGTAIGIYYGYLQLPAVLTATFVFCFCNRFEGALARFAAPLKTLSNCTFGVYLLHPVLIDALRSQHLDFTDYNTFWFFPACYLSFLLLPLAVTFLLRKIPFLRNLVK